MIPITGSESSRNQLLLLKSIFFFFFNIVQLVHHFAKYLTNDRQMFIDAIWKVHVYLSDTSFYINGSNTWYYPLDIFISKSWFYNRLGILCVFRYSSAMSTRAFFLIRIIRRSCTEYRITNRPSLSSTIQNSHYHMLQSNYLLLFPFNILRPIHR